MASLLNGDLATLFTSDLPEGRQNLLDSYSNLERVAEYCENNYFQGENKRAALEETKGYTTQSLASVAYQINTLAYNFLQMLDLQAAQLSEMGSQVNHIAQTVDIHKEKVARREIGVLTTNKSSNRQYKIIAPANPERPAKYVRKPIDYSALDDIGHGVKLAPQQSQQAVRTKRTSSTSGSGQYGTGMMGSSQYAPGMAHAAMASSGYGSLGNVSSTAGPAPTSEPPTPPQPNRYPSGTLTRNKSEYRTPPVVAPPQVPSNYAPNYPRQQPGQTPPQSGKQYGTLPHSSHPQVQMVPPMGHHGGRASSTESAYGGMATMPRLSSSSMRSTGSHSGSSAGGEQPYGILRGGQQHPQMGGTLGRQHSQQQQQQYAQGRGMTPPTSMGGGGRYSASSSQYGTSPAQQQQQQNNPAMMNMMMNRPTQRPPSPPLPPPPGAGPAPGMVMPGVPQQQQQNQPIYQRHLSNASDISAGGGGIYARQQSMQEAAAAAKAAQAAVNNSIYASRQSSVSSMQHQQQAQQQQAQLQQQLARQLSRQSSHGSSIGAGGGAGPGAGASVPGWVPKNYLEKVSAIYDYNADKEDELSFSEGSTIYVLKKNDDGWWEGVMDGVTGLFPGNYVEANL